MTQTTQCVLRALIEHAGADRYGMELSAATALPSGTLYPILARLEKLQWLDSFWEDIDPRIEGRPRRRYYRLSENGLALARTALARAHADRVRISARLRPVAET